MQDAEQSVRVLRVATSSALLLSTNGNARRTPVSSAPSMRASTSAACTPQDVSGAGFEPLRAR